ncbi:MAG: exo-alpha-sialidase [Ruminococcaceae bacterium]|nr:exo-alpha-sialidase [Oscillospiraceae bacterium]
MLITKIWERAHGGKYTHMRIPGITVTSRGDIIICAEARRSGSDWAEIDIVARRSRDGGEMWSEPEDITPATLPHYRNAFALGPGHGIRTSRGVLAFPFWLVPKRFGAPERSHVPSEVGVLCSADDGKTWRTTPILPAREDIVSPNETVASELADGRLYLAVRQNAPARAYAVLESDLSYFCEYAPVEGVRDPVCFGSVASVRESLVLVNCDHAEKRVNVTLHTSADGGKTWRRALTVDESRGGYADIAYDPVRGKIYVLYENEYGRELYLAVIDESEVF